jgi:cellulose synthase/poly-beta-1,6-N-acetylglucosamine synthase-like glycosyltransferase
MTLRDWFGRGVFIISVGGVLIGQLLVGLETVTVRLNFFVVVLVVSVLQALLSAISFTGFMSLSGVLFCAQSITGSDTAPSDDPTPITAIVPVYQDAAVLSTSVESLLESNYPVRVVIVCEPDDRPSVQEANRLASLSDSVTVLENTRYPGTKAGAINYAVESTDTLYIGVFDADERVDPTFLEHAAAGLDDADIVQGRTVPRPDGFLESMAYYESVLLSYVGRRMLYLLTGFRMAASRAVVFRREAFDAVGGYDESMLTEDYYFGYQCYTAGLSVRELLAAPSTIEGAHTVTDWWGQRKRWLRGYMQVLHRLIGDATPPRTYRDVLAIGICGSSVFGGVMLISLLSKFLVLLLVGAGSFAAVPVAVVTGISGIVRYLDYRRGTLGRPGIGWLAAPLLFPLYGFAAIKAVVEYLIDGAGNWYQVQKHSQSE